MPVAVLLMRFYINEEGKLEAYTVAVLLMRFRNRLQFPFKLRSSSVAVLLMRFGF